MQKITPFLWFDHEAEEAVNFYVSIFKNSKIVGTSHYSEEASNAAGMSEGSVLTISFVLDGQEFMALNGGPAFTFTPAISLMVYCETQEEVDWFWEKLSSDPKAEQCGWLKDKYGLSWQIVPTIMEKLMSGKDPEKSRRAMVAMLKMKKLDIETLQRAFDGK